MELLRGVAATLRLPGPGEDPTVFTKPPKVTVTRDSDGTVILKEQLTTEHGEGEDIYFTVDVPGSDIPEVDLLTAVWADGTSTYTTHADVVGGFVTSLKAIKDKLDEEATAEELAAKREIALGSIEEACGVAFRPRYQRDVLDGNGEPGLMLSQPRPLKILSVKVGGEPVELSEVSIDPAGIAIAAGYWPSGEANVEIIYIHGFETLRAAELPVRDLAAYLLTQSPTDWSERATGMSNEMGSYSFVTPGVRGAVFPLPSVNAFVEEHRYSTVA